jgi:hypothetical protein
MQKYHWAWPVSLSLPPSILVSAEVSVYNSDFNDKIGSFSTKHFYWAKLMKEHVLKQENDDNDYDKIIDRFFSGCQDNNSNYVATGSLDHKILKCPFIQVFTHPKEKLNDHQVPLYVFFKGNPCPAHQP